MPERGQVLVANALTPSQLVAYARQGVAAAVTEVCGARSHTAILARSLALPFLTGVKSACSLIPNQAPLIVDANLGVVAWDPTASERLQYASLFESVDAAPSEAAPPAMAPVTSDGARIQLLLNVSDPAEAGAVNELGADGVGLFRTEFTYMARDWWPTEEESYADYRAVADRIGQTELHIRLADFGAEKCPAYAEVPINRNPNLGLRGIRLLLQREEILRPQLLALARLARERPVTVLVPMLDSIDTLEAAGNAVCRILGCASRDQWPFQWGCTIEVPAAALMADRLLEHCDSLSIGLDDLNQYLMAADRADDLLEEYRDVRQPALLKLLHDVVRASRRHLKPVTVCGELAGDQKLTGLLLALGVRRLSVSRSNFLQVHKEICRLSLRAMQGLDEVLLSQASSREVKRVTDQMFQSPH
jgi:phosphotransferase system enzyme I (PtsI)